VKASGYVDSFANNDDLIVDQDDHNKHMIFDQDD
jgi:hypothetical protein